MFPVTRMRRHRYSETVRDLFSETVLSVDKLIMPVFVDENLTGTRPVSSMPGISRYGLDTLPGYLASLEDSGIRAVILFGIPSRKDHDGTEAYNPRGIVQKSIRAAGTLNKLVVIPDLCMCEYTDSGHCGILNGNGVSNDETLESYKKIALSYAEAGARIVAPSGMIDGQVAAIRLALDDAGYNEVMILAYSAKYASTLYSPFREAADSKPAFGDRKSYQMDPRNVREALREMELDISEGADIIMVKPALFYLDVLARARSRFDVPIAAYSVSAEYSMIMNGVNSGLLPPGSINEAIVSIFRGGADMVITYFAEWLARNQPV